MSRSAPPWKTLEVDRARLLELDAALTRREAVVGQIARDVRRRLAAGMPPLEAVVAWTEKLAHVLRAHGIREAGAESATVGLRTALDIIRAALTTLHGLAELPAVSAPAEAPSGPRSLSDLERRLDEINARVASAGVPSS